MYTPTGITNKWTAEPQPLSFAGRTYTIPAHTKIMVNGTGVHFNPRVWGSDADLWRPARWIAELGEDSLPGATFGGGGAGR